MTQPTRIDTHLTLTEGIGPNPLTDVYLGHLNTTGNNEPIAVRLVDLSLCDAAARQRVEREGRALDALGDPRVVAPMGLVRFDEEGAVMVPYVDGVDGESLTRHGAWTHHRVVAVAREVAQALLAMERAGLSHGSLCPAAIRLTPTGEVRLVGLEVAALTAPRGEGTLGVHASARSPYLAPEQLFDIHRPASDVYALAAVMVTWMTGAPMPARGFRPDAHGLMVREVRARLVRCEVPRVLRTLLSRMLSFFPDKRPEMATVYRCLEKRAHPMGEVLSDWGPAAVRALKAMASSPEKEALHSAKTQRLGRQTVWMRRLVPQAKVTQPALEEVEEMEHTEETVEAPPPKPCVKAPPVPRKMDWMDVAIRVGLAFILLFGLADVLAIGTLALLVVYQSI